MILFQLQGSSVTKSVVYKATVTRIDNNQQKTYIGLTENTFKTRYTDHTASFRHQQKRHSTALSNYIWTLKEQQIQHDISWKIIAKAAPYSTTSKTCQLCLEEKYNILHNNDTEQLNKRDEILSTCRHRKKHLLHNFTPPQNTMFTISILHLYVLST